MTDNRSSTRNIAGALEKGLGRLPLSPGGARWNLLAEDVSLPAAVLYESRMAHNLRFMQAFDVDPGKVNVNGGAIAMGHPLGATGAIIIGTLLDEMERSDVETGLATLCIASGMGAATVLERV